MTAPTPTANAKTTLLVVDDSPDNILLLTAILDPYYRLKVAINGERALKIAFSDPPPDLILLDVMMPGISGYEVCQRLKADAKTQDIPVIFVTAKAESEDEVQGLTLGAVDYLTKPVMPVVVLARVRTHLALNQARRELEQARQALERANRTLQHEKDVVENIMARMRSSVPFDHRHVRYMLSSVDRTAGDMVLSAYRADGCQHILVGDFSGHGLPAAVGGPLVSYIFYTMTEQGQALETILREINRVLLRQLPTHLYMAACGVEISTDRRRATFWNHGLPPVLMLRTTHVEQRIAPTGLPLGIDESLDLTPSIVLQQQPPGSRIYIYSDGITELPSPQGEEFGLPRLEDLLATLHLTAAALETIWTTLVEYHGDERFPDDATLMEITL